MDPSHRPILTGHGTSPPDLITAYQLCYYHKPFPHLSDVVYSYPDTCVVPFYKGYEKHSKFNPQDGYMSPTRDALLRRTSGDSETLNGYGYIGFSNKELKWDSSCTLDTPWVRSIWHVPSVERDGLCRKVRWSYLRSGTSRPL